MSIWVYSGDELGEVDAGDSGSDMCLVEGVSLEIVFEFHADGYVVSVVSE